MHTSRNSSADEPVSQSAVPVSQTRPELPAPVPVTRATRRRVPVRLLVMVSAGVIGGLGGAGLLPGAGAYAVVLFCLGALLGTNLAMLVMGVSAGLSGMAVVWASVGAGRWVGSTARGERLVVFRMLPLIVAPSVVVTDRTGLRQRLWWTAALCVAVEAAVAVVLIASGGAGVLVGLGLLEGY